MNPRVEHASVRNSATARDDWRTPESVLERVEVCFNGRIGTDPCTTQDNPTCAANWWIPESDGLAADWSADAPTAFVNCPYSQLLAWMRKCEEQARRGVEIIALIPARTDTKAWHTCMASAQAFCMWRGRIKFVGAENGAPFPSALVYWGKRPWRFEEAFSEVGKVVRL